MRDEEAVVAGLVGLVFILLQLAFALFALWASIYGLVLAFSASILVGLLALFVQPAPLVVGLVYMFWGVNLAEKFLAWIN